jgi:glycosyltransferase involved in cell wall biosynthesis
MKSIFLESHHVKNLTFGLGQFNFHLLKSLLAIENDEFEFVLHAKDIDLLRDKLGLPFQHKKYYSLRRYPTFRIRKKYDLWHSLNQNTKIEPFHNSIPYLLTVHNIPFIRNEENYKHLKEHQFFQEKLNRSNAITYISNFAKQSTHDFYDVPDVPEYVIYNGNPISAISVPEGFRPAYVPEKPFLFSIGEITGRKNFIAIAKMMAHLPGFELVIAGKNSTKEAEEINALAKELGSGVKITLPGKISETEKQYYYKECAAFLFPSLREGFGLPVIEAMRFGKPVISSDTTSLPEIGGELASYWNHFDPEYMAETVKTAIATFGKDSENISEKLIARAQEFNWDHTAHQYFDVYRKMLL